MGLAWDAAGPPKPSRGAIQLPITHGGGWVEEVCEQLDYGCEDVEGGEGYCGGVGWGVEILAESGRFLEGTTEEMMRI